VSDEQHIVTAFKRECLKAKVSLGMYYWFRKGYLAGEKDGCNDMMEAMTVPRYSTHPDRGEDAKAD